MTKNIPEDDQLFIGLEKMVYNGADESDNMIETQQELEAALAIAPNGSLFGSSYYRVTIDILIQQHLVPLDDALVWQAARPHVVGQPRAACQRRT